MLEWVLVMNNEEKLRKNMKCLDKWLSNHEKQKWIADYLKLYRIRQVGIYGYGILGKHLFSELQGQGFPVSWVIDRSFSGDDICCKLVKPEDSDKLEDVDMAVVTSLANVEEMENVLLKFVTGKIVSIEELIDSIYVWGNQN